MLTKLISAFCTSSLSDLNLSNLRVFQHAFATPISSLLLSLDRYLDSDQTKIGVRELVEMKQLTLRLKRLLELSLEDEVVGRHQLARFSVVEALEELKTFFTHKQLKLVVSHELNQPVYLSGSKLYFQEAMINLIKNAFEAYPPGVDGIVVVTAHRFEHLLKIDIVDFASHQKGHVSIKPFGGWGVGLPFARRVIQEMFSGQLEFEIFHTRGSHIGISLTVR